MTTSFREQLWDAGDEVYRRILEHPFLRGLTDGTLPHAAFRHFVVQDSYYLRDYARALAVCAAKAPTEDDVRAFASDAVGALAARGRMAELGPAGGSLSAGARRRTSTACCRPRAPTPAICWPPSTPAPSPRGWRRCCPATGSTPGSARRCWPSPPPTRCTRAGSRPTRTRASRPWCAGCWS
ncbi:hypothetical protein GXW82_32760 [Streptacidiphilus sp. 4-A2]|nr:hypothetical protein [Streptacidiphilus sp. 4-A2]